MWRDLWEKLLLTSYWCFQAPSFTLISQNRAVTMHGHQSGQFSQYVGVVLE